MIKVRKPDLGNLQDGVPKDFLEVMGYFNRGLRKGSYLYIPRKNLITPKEIRTLWLPSIETNICFVAELDEKVIGSATCFFDVASSAYEQAKERKPGEIALTVAPDRNHRLVSYGVLSEMIKELRVQNKKAFFHTDSDFQEERLMMQDLGYQGRLIREYERYRKAGLSGKVFEYKLS